MSRLQPQPSLLRLAVAVAVLGSMATAQTPRAEVATDATFVDAAGMPVRLSAYRGERSLVLLFMRGFKGDFACYYCSQQMRAYKANYARLKDAGVEVLAVLPGAKEVRGFLERVGASDSDHPDPNFTAPFPVVLDTDFSACRAFSIAFDPRPEAFPFPVSEPATIVVGKEGQVVYSYHGTSPPDRPSVDAILEVLAHGPPRNGTQPSTSAAAPPPPPASTLPWNHYAEGMKLARARGQPVLLDFHALW